MLPCAVWPLQSAQLQRGWVHTRSPTTTRPAWNEAAAVDGLDGRDSTEPHNEQRQRGAHRRYPSSCRVSRICCAICRGLRMAPPAQRGHQGPGNEAAHPIALRREPQAGQAGRTCWSMSGRGQQNNADVLRGKR